MDGYELISPKTGKPCGVFVCGVCNRVTSKALVEECCKPCECGCPSRNRFDRLCSECADIARRERLAKRLAEAELVEWDGSMIFSEDVTGDRDGWFDSPEDLLEHLADEERGNRPEFAFVGRKRVKKLEIGRAIEQMTEDTCEEAELCIADADGRALQAAVDVFNAKYAVVYYEHDYRRKVRIEE